MARHLEFGTHGVDPTSPPWPAYVHDDADAVYEARRLAERARELAARLGRYQGQRTTRGPIIDALCQCDEILSNAASEVDNELDQRGFVVS